MTVFNLRVGESANITKIALLGSAKKRLNSLGITVGSSVTVLAYSLFNSGVLISCGAVRVGLRKSLANLIEVKK